MADDNRKLVGTLYLDLEELKRNIKDANELLQSIGKGIDLTGSIKESVKQSMSALTKEIKSQSGAISQSFKPAFDSSSTSADRLFKEITTFGKDNSIRTVSTYMNELGETIRETAKNGQLLSTSVAVDGK